jgi:two-component system sensor kinase FixL
VQPGDAAIVREEFLGRWVHPGDRTRVAAEFERMDAGKSALDVEYQVVLRDGTTKHLHHLAQAVFGPDGRVQKYVGTIHDVTDRRRAEDEARVLQERLTHFSRLSTMGEMAAGLAHEINQPLSAIANYLQGCGRLIDGIEHPNAQKIHDALAETTHQTLRAGQIIRRLREFVARGETEKRSESINKLVEEASALALVGAKEQGVKTVFRFDTRAGPVLVEKVQIQQVLLNLIRNAIEAMNGCAQKELVVETALLDQGMVEVRVADTGSGLAEEVIPRLFQPFVTTKPTGMGVGLSISKRIIEAHGGEMSAEPNPGGGTLFRFTLESDMRREHAG